MYRVPVPVIVGKLDDTDTKALECDICRETKVL